MSQYQFDLRRICSAEDLHSLKQDWDDLYERADQPYLSQGYDWAVNCWEVVAHPLNQQLYVYVLRTENRADLIWPIVVSREYFICRIAEPLRAGTEYSSALVADGQQRHVHVATAWKWLRRTCRADVFRFNNVRADSPLYKELIDARAVRTAHEPARYTDFGTYASWEDFHGSLSRNLRSDQRRKERRLAERGRVSFDVVAGGKGYHDLLLWMRETKQIWMQAKHLEARHIRSDTFWDFLESMGHKADSDSGLLIFTLTLDNKVIAASLIAIDKFRVEQFVRGFDLSFQQLSPGRLLMERELKWAFEHKLIYDARMGYEPYKLKWTNRVCDVSSFKVSNSMVGFMFLKLREAALAGRGVMRAVRNNLKPNASSLASPPHTQQCLKSILPRSRHSTHPAFLRLTDENVFNADFAPRKLGSALTLLHN